MHMRSFIRRVVEFGLNDHRHYETEANWGNDMNSEEKVVGLPVPYRRSEEHRPSTLIGGYSRPVSEAVVYLQLVLFLLDMSGSMSEKGKADAAEVATGEAVDILAEPRNQNAFEVAIVHYDGDVELVAPIQKATELAGNVPPLEPRGMTNIHRALDFGRSLLLQPRTDEEGIHLRPVTILMSDGNVTDGPSPPESAADLVKQVSDLVCIPFGRDADEDLLRQLSTSPDHCLRVNSGQDLRRFFASLSTAISQSRRAGMDATKTIAAVTRSLR